MKLKALLLVALAVAGVGASIAVADNGKGGYHGGDHGCRAVDVSGTVGPQTFVITVVHAGKLGPANGSTVAVTIGGTGQTVRANVNECTGLGRSGTTTSATATSVRSVELSAFNGRPAATTAGTTGTTTTTATTTYKHHHHHGG
jgi:hypothetical protein